MSSKKLLKESEEKAGLTGVSKMVEKQDLSEIAYEVSKLIDRLEPLLWEKVRDLNSKSYDSKHEQMRQAQSIGFIGEAIEHLMKAGGKIREAR